MNRYCINYTYDAALHKTEFEAENLIDALADFVDSCKDKGHKDIMLVEMRSYVKSKFIPTTEVI